PRWIIRWGITIMLLVVIVLIGGSFIYKYPDLIKARITILSVNPPVQIVTKSNGKIDQLLVQNNQSVKKDDVLAVIENTANYADARELLSMFDSLTFWFNTPDKFRDVSFSEEFSLGQYQPYLSAFISQLRN